MKMPTDAKPHIAQLAQAIDANDYAASMAAGVSLVSYLIDLAQRSVAALEKIAGAQDLEARVRRVELVAHKPIDLEPAIIEILAKRAGPKTTIVHPDDAAVEEFAAAMKAKLAKKREEGRGGWHDPAACDVNDLGRELIKHLPKGDAVDVANFAMMLFHREGGVAALKRAVLEWPDQHA